jgi:hypothetical protein
MIDKRKERDDEYSLLERLLLIYKDLLLPLRPI